MVAEFKNRVPNPLEEEAQDLEKTRNELARALVGIEPVAAKVLQTKEAFERAERLIARFEDRKDDLSQNELAALPHLKDLAEQFRTGLDKTFEEYQRAADELKNMAARAKLMEDRFKKKLS